MNTFHPLGSRVLIRPDEQPSETASGLVVVQDKQPDQRGIVVSVGPGCREVDVGDDVIFSWMVGQELWLHHGQERFLIMHEEDILAVVKF